MDTYECIDKNGKLKTVYSCITCGFLGSYKNYKNHTKTDKHKYNMTGELKYKKNQVLKCEKCNFQCINFKDYKRHLDSNKHSDINYEHVKQFICECGVSYKYASGLSRHRKKCKVINKPKVHEEIVDEKEQQIRLLKETNKELAEAIFKLQQIIDEKNK